MKQKYMKIAFCVIMVFSAVQVACQKNDINGPPLVGKWEGLTKGDAFWLQISFEVDSSQKNVINIACHLGFKGDKDTFASWQPSGEAASISADGSFRYEDNFGNRLLGKFTSVKSAQGSFDGFRVEDDKKRKSPTRWKANFLK